MSKELSEYTLYMQTPSSGGNAGGNKEPGTNGTKEQRKSEAGKIQGPYEQQAPRQTAPGAPRPSTLVRRG